MICHSKTISALLFLAIAASLSGAELAAQDATADGQPSVADSTALRVEATADPAGWQIMQGDQQIAGYISDSAGRPVIYPIVGPGGHHMTRTFPFDVPLKGEKLDHPHHRSLWLTHGEVNDIDFWLVGSRAGKIIQRSGTAEVAADGSVVIVTENDWMTPDESKRVLADTRRFTFFNDNGRRIIDCDFLLKATDGDVNFGDTKEGSFGMRVAGTMKVEAKQGGQITNAEGETNGDAWGKKSAWVDYTGPVDGDTVGITIHDHPSSFGHPCRWHVRTYGLFAANPFGVHHFTNTPRTDGVVLKDGTRMRLNYRVVLREGDFDAAQAAQDAQKYANDPRPELQ
jgi:hypothetical protein